MKYLIGLWLLFTLSATSYGASGTAYDPKNINDFDKTKLNFNGMKVGATVAADSTQNLDLTLTDDHLISGASVTLYGNCADDEVKFQVLMGSTVVASYIDWFAKDMDKTLEYPAKIPAGLTLRVVYKNTCPSESVKVRINYHLHKVLI